MKVEETADGKWAVKDGERIVATFDSNSAAWRFVDRNEVHPLHLTNSQADARGAWSLPIIVRRTIKNDG